MTTLPINSDRAAADAAWAGEQLGLGTPLDVAGMRGKLWRQLRRAHEFLPPSDWQLCARLVLQSAPAEMSPHEAISTGRRDALREQVETFAAGFFRLSPHARRARWEELTQLCRPHAPLLARLESLAIGLAVDLEKPAAQARPEIAELRQEICRLFVLRPQQRAATLLAFRERTSADRAAWEQTAQMLETWHPDVAALNKPLLRDLKQWRHFQAQAARRKRGLLAADRERPAPFAHERNSRWPGWIIVAVGVGLMRLILSGAGSTSSTHSTDLPRFQPRELNERYSPAQRESMRRLNEAIDQLRKNGPHVPPVANAPQQPPPAQDDLSTQELEKTLQHIETLKRPPSPRSKTSAPMEQGDP